MRRALIIGHTGQDGSILWEQLAARGFSLVGISSSEVRASRPEHAPDPGVPTSLRALETLQRFRPDQVYYLAARHHSSQESVVEEEVSRDSWAINVHAFSDLLHGVEASCPGARVFYASSSRVYGASAVCPQDENTPLRPSCIYGVTKAAAMLLSDYYRRAHGLFVSCGILFNHESPLRHMKFISQRVAHGLVALKHGCISKLEVGSLDARVDWGYAPDYTRAMQLILEADNAENFVIASGSTHSVRDMVSIGAEYLGMAWQGKVFETSRLLRRDSQELCGDATRLRQVTGWDQSVDFKQLVRIMIDAAVDAHERNNCAHVGFDIG